MKLYTKVERGNIEIYEVNGSDVYNRDLLEQIAKSFSNEANMRNFGLNPSETNEEARRTFLMLISSFGKGYVLIKDNKYIGFIQIYKEPNLYRDANSLTIGYYLDEEYQGYGYMKECLIALFRKLYGKEGFTKIYVGHRDKNEHSKKIIQKLGFNYLSRTLKINYTGALEPENNYIMSVDEFYNKWGA
jgi:RimJ/RimL family protein N-acetyltransferase